MPSKSNRSIMIWVWVCLGEAQYARQIKGPDYPDQNEEDDGPVFEILQTAPTKTIRATQKAGRDPMQKAERDAAQRPNSKPKANQNKKHDHSGHMKLTEG